MENTEKNTKLSGECSRKNLYIMFTIVLVCMVIFCCLCHSRDKANVQTSNQTKKTPEQQFFLSLVSKDYMQDEISYAPRFVQGKDIIYIALSNAKRDSIILFSPSDKMSDDEYNHWLGKSKGAYEYITGKVVE